MIQEKEFQKFWYGKRVFLTGHSGFKGSWLYFWLKEMGADVTGYSLKPRKYEILPTLLGIPIKSQDDLIDITKLTETGLRISYTQFKKYSGNILVQSIFDEQFYSDHTPFFDILSDASTTP